MREAKFYSFDALIKYVTPATKVSTVLEPSLPLAFDTKNKGRSISIEGATASTFGLEWQSAFTQSFTTGIHSVSVTPDNEIIIGICGASIVHAFKGGAHVQDYSMMLHSSGTLFVTGRKTKQFSSFSMGSSVRVELDCDRRTVTWSFGSNRYTESLHPLMQAPFTFCVDLNGSTTVTITALK